MFGSDKKQHAAASVAAINIVGNGTAISGDILSHGDIRIDGTVKGNIVSRSKLVLGSTSVIEGDIEAQNADIEGQVKGNVRISEGLLLKASARIHGNIQTGKLVVEAGAEFNGNCVMVSKTTVEQARPSNEENIPRARKQVAV